MGGWGGGDPFSSSDLCGWNLLKDLVVRLVVAVSGQVWISVTPDLEW